MGNHRADRRGHGRGPSDDPGRRAPPRPAGARPSRAALRSRGPLLRGLPSAPILLGVAALAVSAGGAVTAAGPELDRLDQPPRSRQASALSGASDVSRGDLLDARTAAVSRDSRRDALADAADAKLVDQAEEQARQRNAALAQFAKQAEAQADKIALNQWVLPVDGYHLTARFGESSGLWAHLPHRPRLRRPERHPDPRGRQRRRHLDRLRRLLRQQDRRSPSTTAPSCGSATRRVRRQPRRRRSAPARSSATSAPPATSPARTCTSRSAPAAATRSTRTRRWSSTGSSRSTASRLSLSATRRSRARRRAHSFSTGA